MRIRYEQRWTSIRCAGAAWTLPLVADELAEAVRRPKLGEMVVQTLARGREYTIDVLADRDGRCVCVVPRLRIEVRSGEVSKGVTVRSPRLQDLAGRICAALPGAFGTLIVQVFVDGPPDDAATDLAVIEINARYGGGFPLALEAGADFPAGSSRSCSACPPPQPRTRGATPWSCCATTPPSSSTRRTPRDE